jgi:hypothetical protein
MRTNHQATETTTLSIKSQFVKIKKKQSVIHMCCRRSNFMQLCEVSSQDRSPRLIWALNAEVFLYLVQIDWSSWLTYVQKVENNCTAEEWFPYQSLSFQCLNWVSERKNDRTQNSLIASYQLLGHVDSPKIYSSYYFFFFLSSTEAKCKHTSVIYHFLLQANEKKVSTRCIFSTRLLLLQAFITHAQETT